MVFLLSDFCSLLLEAAMPLFAFCALNNLSVQTKQIFCPAAGAVIS